MTELSGVDDVDEILLVEYDPTFGQIASDEEFGLFCDVQGTLRSRGRRVESLPGKVPTVLPILCRTQ